VRTLILTCIFISYAGWLPAGNSFTRSKTTAKGFIENKGQIIDQDDKPNPAVRYLLNSPGFNVQLRKAGFSYDLYSVERSQTSIENGRDKKITSDPRIDFNNRGIIRNYHRIDIDLIGADSTCIIRTTSPSSEYFNYFTPGTQEKGVTHVKYFSKVTYEGIYPGIDLEMVTGDETGFKYNFILHPGSKVEAIKLKISGPEIFVEKDSSLIFRTSVGEIRETIPLSYYYKNGVKKIINASFYRIEDNTYGIYTAGNIPGNVKRIIDPMPDRIWGTYYGGELDDESSGLQIDPDNNVVIAGWTNSAQNIATAGAYQTTISSLLLEGYLAKFTPSGQILWATYYGGGLFDIISSISIDNGGYIFACGKTTSLSGISTPGAFQTTRGGNNDAFLVKFRTDGTRVWGTYYGGELNEISAYCSVDNLGHVYLAGETNSVSGISTPGTWQFDYGGGDSDGFIAKMDTNGKDRLWGTYYGGSLDDNIWKCYSDQYGHMLVCGSSNSSNGIASAGVYQETNAGVFDAFMASFDPYGQRIWGSYYGGPNDEQLMDIICSGSDVYAAGWTSSYSGISSPGSFQSLSGGGTDCFVARFNLSGQRIWGTYYGGEEADYAFGLCAAQPGTIVITGGTSSTYNIATPDAFQNVNGGYGDAFLTSFTTEGIRRWASYYGGNGIDDGHECTVDLSGQIYISGRTASTNGIATAGTYQPNFYGGYVDAFIAKFNDCINPSVSQMISGPVMVCKPQDNLVYTVPPVVNATSYTWNIPPGASITSGAGTNSITVTFSTAAVSGIISVKGVNDCGQGDSSFISVTVNSRPVPMITGDNNPCEGMSFLYQTQPGFSDYQWTHTGSLISGGTPSDNSITIQWNSPGSQSVGVNYKNSEGCYAENPLIFPVSVTQSSAVNVAISCPGTTVCEGTAVTFTAIPTNPGNNPVYNWKVNGSTVGTNSNVFTYIPSNNDLVVCILTSDVICSTGNPATSNIIAMTVTPPVTVGVSVSTPSNSVCAGTSVTFTASPINPGSTPVYQWKVNGVNAGTNSTVFTYTPVNGDIVSCVLTSSLTNCVTSNPATSNPVTMTVDPLQPVSLTIGANATSVCSGTPVTFTANPINGGSLPVFQWKRNGENSGTNSPTFIYTPVNGDIVSCILTSSLTTCVIGNPSSSNPITITVNPLLPVSISIASSVNPVCTGSAVTFTANPTNPGSAPMYQWKVNGVNSGTNSNLFTYFPSNNDQILCVMTSSEPCAINNPAPSSPVTQTVNPLPSVSFTSCFDTITTVTAQAFKLKGGVPIGGTYSGPGVNSTTGYFTPSIAGAGVKTITYSYQNTYSCIDVRTRSIIVQAAPAFSCGQLLTDIRDGKTYPTVLLGTQCWMQKNLDHGIMTSAVNHQKDNCTAEKYCYNDDAANCSLFGGLYQWDELMQFQGTAGAQGACPPGWHVPTQGEWMTLFNFYQNQALAGKPLQDSIISGFRALESGVSYSNAAWKFKGFASIFWSSTSSGAFKAISHGMNQQNFSVSDYYSNRSNAFGVRCVRD